MEEKPNLTGVLNLEVTKLREMINHQQLPNWNSQQLLQLHSIHPFFAKSNPFQLDQIDNLPTRNDTHNWSLNNSKRNWKDDSSPCNNQINTHAQTTNKTPNWCNN